jgi:ATP/maltotriose-dependent transcriptional regulator MalT
LSDRFDARKGGTLPNGMAKVVGNGAFSALAEAPKPVPSPGEPPVLPLASAERAYRRGDLERAAALVEDAALILAQQGDWATVMGWIDRLPEPVLAGRPWLCLAQAWSLAQAGHLADARDVLARLTAWPANAGRLSPDLLAGVAALEALVAAGIAEAEAQRRRISDAFTRLVAAGRERHPRCDAAGPGNGAIKASNGAHPANGRCTGLTQREIEVLEFVSRGLSNRELASRLDLSETTVKWHLRNIFGKLGVANRTEAVFSARNSHLIA